MSTPVVMSDDILRIDPALETNRIVDHIRHTVFTDLRRRGVVVGVSGGIDSSVVAYLCARALGKARVLALFTPETDSSSDSLRLGRMVAHALGIRSVVEDVSSILRATRSYERRDDSVREVVPEYSAGDKCKIVLPNLVDADRYSLLRSRPVSGRPDQEGPDECDCQSRCGCRDELQAARTQVDGVLLRRSASIRRRWHSEPT